MLGQKVRLAASYTPLDGYTSRAAPTQTSRPSPPSLREVDGLLGAGYNTQGEDVLEMKADLGREVVVEENKWPGGLLASAVRCKTIGGEPKGNVSWIGEVLVEQHFVVNSDMLTQELLIVLRVHDVRDDTGLRVMTMGLMLHQSR